MKVSELFMPRKAVKKKDKDVHMAEQNLPVDEIKSFINIAFEQGEDYQRILKQVGDKFGPDALHWSRRYMANVLSER